MNHSEKSLAERLPSLTEIVVVVALALLLVPTYRLIRQLVRPYFSALRALPGPKSSSIFLGNIQDFQKVDEGAWHERMVQEYGHVVAYTELIGSKTLFTMDIKALNHITDNSMVYQRPRLVRWVAEPSFGSLTVVGGAVHKRQRRTVNPAFSTRHIREMTGIFVSKSQQLREVLRKQVFGDKTDSKTGEEKVKIDVLSYLTRVTWDIIGLAGFNYPFNALEMPDNVFSAQFTFLLDFVRDLRFFADRLVLQLLKGIFPLLRSINFDEQSRKAELAQKIIMDLSKQVVEESKKRLTQVQDESFGLEEQEGSKATAMEVGDFKSKDLLSLMLKANMKTLANGEKGLSDKELMHQIPNFLLAGHETTANSACWTLMELAAHPEMQVKLRKELHSLDIESPTMEQLNSLPYLDAVVRESLRLNSIVPSLDKVAVEDDIIPVDKPYVDRYGQMKDHIRISKGDGIYLPLKLINTSTEIWGDDAKEFNPDRWKSPPPASNSIRGMGNQFTFNNGPHGCIGFLFAIIELKALLFTLIKAFEFEMAVSVEDFDQSPDILKRPKLKSEPQNGFQLPIFIKHAHSPATVLVRG